MINVALAVQSQSVEQGAARTPDGLTRVAFTSKYTGIRDPIQPKGVSQSSGGQGSMWPMVIDYFYERGINLHVVNCGVGSSGIIRDWCGQVFTYSSAGVYYPGDVVVPTTPNGHLYRVTTSANSKGASGFFVTLSGSTTAGTEPGSWNVAGGTSTSGNGIVFTDAGLSNKVGGAILAHTDPFWDPLSLHADVATNLNALGGFAKKCVYVAFGQNDAGDSASRYRDAHLNATAFYRSQGFDVILGMSSLQLAPNKASEYATLFSGLTAAIVANDSDPAVMTGPNLYTRFGADIPQYVESDGTTRVHLTARGVEIAANYVAPILYDRIRARL